MLHDAHYNKKKILFVFNVTCLSLEIKYVGHTLYHNMVLDNLIPYNFH